MKPVPHADVARRVLADPSPHNEVPSLVRDLLCASGSPLSEDARAFFEPRFGRDFSDVRVHTDAAAASSARAVDAHAYTAGRHIVFDEAQYAPHTSEGRSLLAHELTHVVQQSQGPADGRLTGVSQPGDAGEREATALTAGTPRTRSYGLLQRFPRKKKTSLQKGRTDSVIGPEAVTGIIAEHLHLWYMASRSGVDSAVLEGDDEAAKWFCVALLGNLVWAATVFVAPEMALARFMAFGGAAVGSGMVQKMLEQDLPTGDFRKMVQVSLGSAYRTLAENQSDLVQALLGLYAKAGLLRDEAGKPEQRRRMAWEFLFRSTLGYKDPARLEAEVKGDIEAVWRCYLPSWKTMRMFTSPEIRATKNPVIYYRALVESGVADKAIGVKKRTLTNATFGPRGEILITNSEEFYEFPGGATARRTPYSHDAWYGSITAQVPTP